MPYTSLARSIVTVTHPEIPQSIEWTDFEGGGLSLNSQRFYTGPKGPEKVFAGRRSRENATTKAYVDPIAHADFLAKLNAGYAFEGAVLTVSSTDAGGNPIGTPDTYKGCQVGQHTPRQVNNNSEEMQIIPVEWEIPAP